MSSASLKCEKNLGHLMADRKKNIGLIPPVRYRVKIDNNFNQSPWFNLSSSTDVKMKHSELYLGRNQNYVRQLIPISFQLIFPWNSSIYKIKNVFVVRYYSKIQCRLFRHMASPKRDQGNFKFNTTLKMCLISS